MKCKRILIGLLSLTLAASSVISPVFVHCPVSQITASAEDVPLNPGIQYENCGDHIEITGYDGSYTYGSGINLDIPETIEELPVTKICPGAFKGIRKLFNIGLPMTIEEIGDEAFDGCKDLVIIHFPSELRTIGKRAFYGCSFNTLTLPDTVSEIGEEAFGGTHTLNYVILPDALRTLPSNVFTDDTYLSSISIPASLERIEHDAFSGCERMETICYKGSAAMWSVISIGSGNESLQKAEVFCDFNKQKVERDRVFDPEKDTWGFTNKELEDYLLSDESLSEMTKGMHILYKNQIENYWRYTEETGTYHGTCLGFATTSILASAGILDPSELDPDATCLHDVKLTDEVRELITYYYVLQGTDAFKESDVRTDEKMAFYLEQGIPILVSYGGFYKTEDGQSGSFGHAVVAYGIERGSFEFDGYVFHTRLITYDSNITADDERDGSIYMDCEDPKWYSGTLLPEQKIYVPYGADRGHYGVMWFPPEYSVDYMNLFGKNKGVDYIEPEQKCALLRTSDLPSGYKMLSYSPEDPGSKTDAECTQGKAGDYQALQCVDGQKGYVLEMQDKQDLDCSMSYENNLYLVNGTDLTSAAFEPDGAVSITGKDMQYQLRMIADEEHHPTSYYELRISGENADEVSVRQTEGGYVITGTDLHDVTIEALNDSKGLSLTFSTDASQVLVHETEDNTFTVSADVDGDGSFETVLTSAFPDLGDVNGDGSINAKDANEVLIAAAKIGTGQDHGLTAAQQKAADVDGNGTINAEDAAWILRYAAMSGTDTTQDSLETFIVRNTPGLSET